MTGPSASARHEAVRCIIASGRRVRLAVRGESMLPTLREPMILEVAAPSRRTRMGDIVVFPMDANLVVHRAVGTSGRYVVTSGDAQPQITELVPPEAILGRVVALRAAEPEPAVGVDGFLWRFGGLYYALVRPIRTRWRAVRGRFRT